MIPDMAKLFLPLLVGTARAERRSEQAARYVFEEMEKYGFETQFVDVRDHLFGSTVAAWVDDQRAKPWRELMTRADGLVIVSPEYNHGYPGELKILLDSAYNEYAGKPVAICGVSNGVFGGSRMIENLRTALLAMQLLPILGSASFPKVQDLFDESGVCKDPSAAGRLTKMFDELSWTAAALKSARAARK